MSTIRRVNRPADNFTMVSNAFARDARLSFEAVGLGLWLLSHVAGWETSVKAIVATGRAGRDRVNRILRELEDFGYLRRTQERDERGRATVMAYEIQCTPFPEETPDGTGSLESRRRLSRFRPIRTHKKTTSKKTTHPEEQHPSGGATADAAPPTVESLTREEEEPVSPDVETLALFDAPPKAAKTRSKLKSPPSPGANTVVAKYVDAYRAAHGGENPLKPHIGRVARDAKGILERGEAGPDELERAAVEMGQGAFCNLGMALIKHRERRAAPPGARQGMAPASPHTDPYWQEAGERNRSAWYQKLLTDDDVVAWVREDPAAVEEILQRWPGLEPRLRGTA